MRTTFLPLLCPAAARPCSTVVYGLASEPSREPPTGAGATLSTKTVFAAVDDWNQKSKEPPAIPSRLPSIGVPCESTTVFRAAAAGTKPMRSR